MGLFKKKKNPEQIGGFKEHEDKCHSGGCPCFLDGQADMEKELIQLMDSIQQVLTYHDRTPYAEKTPPQTDSTQADPPPSEL